MLEALVIGTRQTQEEWGSICYRVIDEKHVVHRTVVGPSLSDKPPEKNIILKKIILPLQFICQLPRRDTLLNTFFFTFVQRLYVVDFVEISFTFDTLHVSVKCLLFFLQTARLLRVIVILLLVPGDV